MKEKVDKLTHHRRMHMLCAAVFALCATYLIYSAVMLLFVFKGDYHGRGFSEMLAMAEQRSDEHQAASLLTELSLCPARDYDYRTGEETQWTYKQVREYWIERAADYEGMENGFEYAVIVTWDEEDFTKNPQYIFRSEGFTTYTEYLEVQAFVQEYYNNSESYSMLLEAPYKNGWVQRPGDELLFGTPLYLTILFQHKEDVSALHSDQYAFVRAMYETDHHAGLLVIPVLLCVLSLVQFVRSAGYRKGEAEVQPGFTDRIPLLFWAAAMVLAGGCWLVFLSDFFLTDRAMAWFTFREYALLFTASFFVMTLLGMLFLSTFCVRIKSKTVWKTTLIYYILRWAKKNLAKIGNWAYEHIPLAVRLAIALPVLGVISLIEAAMIEDCGMDYLVPFVLARLCSIAICVYLFWGYSKLRDGAAKIAAGRLEKPVDEKHLTPDYRMFAKNLNSVGESIRIAVEERMKSERLKTQLITNVSHDIKTPLTSIINYVDLLSQSDATDEEKKEYLDILAHQSDRLKKLIQDLIDASKASSGAVEVDLAEVDLNTLAGQVSGEYQDKLDAANLTLIAKNTKDDVRVSADSNLLWRVLDNLYVNILKYAMPGTRVYTETAEENGVATFSISNISKAELGVSGEELMERFVRGDGSRNTEGSGLGLSIAKSLMELMGGDLDINVDGDMFKAVLKLKAA